MSAKKPDLPGFVYNEETGKYVPVPVDFSAVFGLGAKSPCQTTWSRSKREIEGASYQPTKVRKTETRSRKELYKVPDKSQNNITKKAPSIGVRKSVASTLNLNPSYKKLLERKNITPMITVTEPSEEQQPWPQASGFHFRAPLTSLQEFNTTPKNQTNIKIPDSPGLQEFQTLEQICKTPKLTNESPMTTVCNLFGSRMMLDSNNDMNKKDIIAEMRHLIQCYQELIKDTSRKIKELLDSQTRQEENVKQMIALVDKLDNNKKNEEKENHSVRRSLRLQSKSPVILKPDDLRKTALTRSLSLKFKSPKMQKALEMYNSTKTTCAALLTPKVSKGQVENSPTHNLRIDLSMKIKQQCLMLQDTPVHK